MHLLATRCPLHLLGCCPCVLWHRVEQLGCQLLRVENRAPTSAAHWGWQFCSCAANCNIRAAPLPSRSTATPICVFWHPYYLLSNLGPLRKENSLTILRDILAIKGNTWRTTHGEVACIATSCGQLKIYIHSSFKKGCERTRLKTAAHLWDTWEQ
jgi:hypothetical protein